MGEEHVCLFNDKPCTHPSVCTDNQSTWKECKWGGRENESTYVYPKREEGAWVLQTQKIMEVLGVKG